MDENELRLDYWVDTRSHPEFPLWVIFKEIGHERDKAEGHPYGRRSNMGVGEMLKQLELAEGLGNIAHTMGIPEQELRAGLWYASWMVEKQSPPADWEGWNSKVDEAWRQGQLRGPA
jgi:hypothetical protein